jgi:hypothetical protein
VTAEPAPLSSRSADADCAAGLCGPAGSCDSTGARLRASLLRAAGLAPWLLRHTGAVCGALLMLGALAALLPGAEGLGACNVLLATSAFTLARLTHVNEAAGEGGDAVAVGWTGAGAAASSQARSVAVSPLPSG